MNQPIIDYIINVFADEDFDFGEEGKGAFEALGQLLVPADYIADSAECCLIASIMSSSGMEPLGIGKKWNGFDLEVDSKVGYSESSDISLATKFAHGLAYGQPSSEDEDMCPTRLKSNEGTLLEILKSQQDALVIFTLHL